ncbi:MAG: cytochrome c oxidase accessory protein CcoG [Halieaceae bacterium]|jgi:cytochrome c oxidase accessory protein FixG|uniref:cytochrome c oxidase accessory protein CcoG n=1 Tax=Haliea alexandrii TaxID=2448162 RepID=UPI000F0B1B4E|nr:cytochrome c oxidase accessory protein CcoG [Haliea alexandrii]MCR9187046.1 cytochrome c oxidase accessory protein CcoG [Halieaceae bacterium]
MSDKHLIDVQDVAPAEVSEIDLYQRREKIYTRKIEGFFQRIRLYTGWPLLIGYFLLPWLSWDGRQAVWFDLPERKFHILGLVFWPQDFPLLAFLLIIAAFGLFAVTVFAGRVWCGYTCPQTVWTSIFMWIEQRFEGSRNQRMRLDKAPWSMEKLGRKVLKHGGWLFVAFLTGMTFVGYFYPIRELLPDLLTLSAGQWGVLWTIFFTCATYINAGWMREQVCKYMCPYARFQSVMFDQDTLIVSYDPVRGEPRGSRKRDADHRAEGLGDCIDCSLCVQVCPTGIDIRDGLQYECIGCALCIDACNSVMDKMSYPRGLISYTSEHQLQGGKTHWLRPRMIGYVLVLSVMVGLFSYRVISRVPLEMTVIRDRNELYVTTMDGDIENIYTLSLVNMEQSMHEFEIDVSGIDGAEIIGDTLHTLDGGEVRSISLRVRIAPELVPLPSTEIEFTARATDRESLQISSESRFMRPL